MKPHTYSSMEAFLAHYRLLKTPGFGGKPRSLTDDGQSLLSEMERLIGILSPDEKSALLDSGETAGQIARRRERAELKLRRALLARGVLQS